MKRSITIAFAIFFLLSFLISFSQRDQNSQFEKCKGKLPFPVCLMYGFSDSRCLHVRPDIVFNDHTLTFNTDSGADVRAIHAGIISKIFNVEDGYAIVTSFGDYYITYYPVVNPSLKKGDPVYTGQPLSRVSATENGYQVNLLLSKNTTFLEPYRWFRWK